MVPPPRMTFPGTHTMYTGDINARWCRWTHFGSSSGLHTVDVECGGHPPEVVSSSCLRARLRIRVSISGPRLRGRSDIPIGRSVVGSASHHSLELHLGCRLWCKYRVDWGQPEQDDSSMCGTSTQLMWIAYLEGRNQFAFIYEL